MIYLSLLFTNMYIVHVSNFYFNEQQELVLYLKNHFLVVIAFVH